MSTMTARSTLIEAGEVGVDKPTGTLWASRHGLADPDQYDPFSIRLDRIEAFAAVERSDGPGTGRSHWEAVLWTTGGHQFIIRGVKGEDTFDIANTVIDKLSLHGRSTP